MTLSTCPITIVHVPVEQVWRLLADPSHYALWWDAKIVSITPAGPAQAGQHIVAQTTALGKRWDVHLTIRAVEPEKRQLDLLTRLPLGITVYNHIRCNALDAHQTRVSFG